MQLRIVNQNNALPGRRMCTSTPFYLADRLHKYMKTFHMKLHVQYGLPDYEITSFETCRRQNKLIKILI